MHFPRFGPQHLLFFFSLSDINNTQCFHFSTYLLVSEYGYAGTAGFKSHCELTSLTVQVRCSSVTWHSCIFSKSSTLPTSSFLTSFYLWIGSHKSSLKPHVTSAYHWSIVFPHLPNPRSFICTSVSFWACFLPQSHQNFKHTVMIILFSGPEQSVCLSETQFSCLRDDGLRTYFIELLWRMET